MTNAVITAQQGSASGNIGFKNRIINGDMRFDQRNNGASVTPASGATYFLDRWHLNLAQSSKVSIQRNAGSVTPPAGFTYYTGITSLSSYSILATDYHTFRHLIEGYNVADLGWGTSNAQTVTLSFWVRSNLSGTFGGTLNNGDYTRGYPFTYTINSANTWEYKTITIPGDITGTWATTNTIGIAVGFTLGTGATMAAGTTNVWNGITGGGYAPLGAAGATSILGITGASWYITGVQFEVGSSATAFDYRDYGRELQMCQRYYETSWPNGAASTGPTNGSSASWINCGSNAYGRMTCQFIVEKRTTPSFTTYAQSDGTSGNMNVWDNGTVRIALSTNIQICTKNATPEMNYGSAYATRAYMYCNWKADAEL